MKKVTLNELKSLLEKYMMTHKNKLTIKQISRMIGLDRPDKLSAYLNKGVKTQETIDRVSEFLGVKVSEKIITKKPILAFASKQIEASSSKGDAEITRKRRVVEDHQEQILMRDALFF